MRHLTGRIFAALCCLLSALHTPAAVSYVSPSGNDLNPGAIEAPFATLGRALEGIGAGDTVYLRGGTYLISESQIADSQGPYAKVFRLSQSGECGRPIRVWGFPGERPVLDFSAVRPQGKRVAAFWVEGNWWHLRGFDIVGVQVSVRGHTQSECITMRGGSHNLVEDIAMHDGMAIGYYAKGGCCNLVLNCDAYGNYDDFSEGPKGGNVDGFGGHVMSPADTGNVFRGCRAWLNSDDGFDLINNRAAFVIDSCWSFLNGYQPVGCRHLLLAAALNPTVLSDSLRPAGDGAGFKSGGYGMRANEPVRLSGPVPMNEVRNCLAWHNRQQGFYANHHLGGLRFEDNLSAANPSNYNMVCRRSAELPPRDVPGYGHIVCDNVSVAPRHPGQHLTNCDSAACVLENNRFSDEGYPDFLDLWLPVLTAPRREDGRLPWPSETDGGQ